MSEELKPCPACGNNYPTKCFDPSLGWKYSIICNVCGMQGPRTKASDEAHAAWNALPRSPHITPNDADCAGCPERRDQGLVWTKEPPTVPGWYWYIQLPSSSPCIVQLLYRGLDTYRLKASFAGIEDDEYVEDLEGQWAGPIPMPEEPVS